jgi:hypothetical protein
MTDDSGETFHPTDYGAIRFAWGDSASGALEQRLEPVNRFRIEDSLCRVADAGASLD